MSEEPHLSNLIRDRILLFKFLSPEIFLNFLYRVNLCLLNIGKAVLVDCYLTF